MIACVIFTVAAFPAILLACYIIPNWIEFKAKTNRQNFTYSITDLWAGIVGVLPSVIVAIYVLHCDRKIFGNIAVWLFVLLVAASQVCGMVIGKLRYEIQRSLRPFSCLQSARYVILGALLALSSPLATFALLFYVLG